jgi:acyl-CoA reductase-like NAD-dependent aldehyde dehydrogenase
MATKKQPRVDVKKTYKLFINGAFPRSESGRVFEVTAKNGDFIANPALASRKDLRDAVTAARAAQSGWSKATAYNRGQILYRIAEMLEGRADQFQSEIALSSQVTPLKAKSQILDAIDRWVWYAGWSDKLQAVSGATNPVSGPFFNFSISEPQGVVAIASPATFIDFIDSVAAAVVSGNTTVVLVPGSLAVPAMSFAEVLATSDLPAGVINILTGSLDELAPWAASHMDIDGFDISGVSKKKQSALKEAGAENLKRIHSFTSGQSAARILAFMESKTVWHSVGV